MDIFSESLTSEETNSQFALNEVDNESFTLEQIGGVYPDTIPAGSEDTILNSMNENRDKWNIEAGYDTTPEISENDAELDNINMIDEEPVAEESQLEQNEQITGLQEPVSTNIEEQVDTVETSSNAINIDDVAIIDDDIAEITDSDTAPENTTDFSSDADINETPTEAQNMFSGLADVEQISSIDDVFNLGSEKSTLAEEITAEEYSEIISDENNISEMDTSNIEEAETVSASAPAATMQIDDELRSLLMNDLQEETPEENIADNAEAPEDTVDNAPVVDDTEEQADKPEQMMDISDDANTTSETVAVDNSELEELTWDSETNEVKTKQKLNKKLNNADKKDKTSDNKEEEDMTEEEEKNSTKKFALILVIVAVVMIFIIGGIIGYLYLSSKSNISTDKASETAQVDSTKSSDSVHVVKADSASTHADDSTAKADSIMADTNKMNKDTTVGLVETEADTPKIQPVQPPSKPKVSAPAKKQQTITNQPRATATKPKTTAPTRATTVAAKTTPSKVTSKSEPMYSIQMYSSPSKSDAEERLVLLARKNISGYITTQQIKGQTWYRVRFGRYATYEEATTEVQRLDLKDAWIERIK